MTGQDGETDAVALVDTTAPDPAPLPRKAVEAPWSPDEPGPRRVWPLILSWTIVAAFLVGASVSAVSAVSRDVYGAGVFVSDYLEAIAAHDAAAALAFPGVAVDADEATAAGLPAESSELLLRGDLLGELSGVTITSIEPSRSDSTVVTASFQLDGVAHEAEYTLEQRGTIAGVFPEWRFAETPLAAVTVAVSNSTAFDVNGLTFDVRSTHPSLSTGFHGGFGATANYLVLTPATYEFGHESRLLEAKTAAIATTAPAETSLVSVVATPNAQFRTEAQAAVDATLDACAAQAVLQPAGCPFGIVINDRVRGDVVWTIAQYPPVTLSSDGEGWAMPASIGYARIAVEVRSLFDGSLDQLDESVSFVVSHRFVLGDDDALTLAPAA